MGAKAACDLSPTVRALGSIIATTAEMAATMAIPTKRRMVFLAPALTAPCGVSCSSIISGSPLIVSVID